MRVRKVAIPENTLAMKGSLKLNRMIPASAIAFAILLLGLTVSPARGDLTITASNVILGPGGTGSMDFAITSNSGDTLSSFGLELLITPVGTPASLLQFAASPNPYSNSNYVFANQSFNADTVPVTPFWSAPYRTNYPSDTITGGDLDNSNQGYVTIPATAGGPLSYLATADFSIPVGAMPGDQFQISLVNDPNFTYFTDQNNNPLTYSSVGGFVTISASVVPEPSSLALVAIPGLCGLIGYSRNRRRGTSPGSSLSPVTG